MPTSFSTNPAPDNQALVAQPEVIEAEYVAASDPTSRSTAMLYYWRLLRRQQWKILAFVVLVSGLALAVSFKLPKQYGASALIRVDPTAALPTENGARSVNESASATLLTTTEAQIVKSPAVVLSTIQTLHLATDPYYRLKVGRPEQATFQSRLLRYVSQQISVSQPFNTELLQLDVRAHSPELAAQIANTLAQTYVDIEYRSRAQALSASAQSMGDQLDRLRAQMEKSEQSLVEYESSNDVLDADSKQNIYNARLEQINQNLSAAQADRIKLEAEYRVTQTGRLSSIMATPPGQSLIPLRNQELADQRLLTQLAAIDGPRHPRYLQQESVVERDRQAIAQQQAQIEQQVASQYAAALIQEKLIRGALAQEKNAVDQFNMRAIRYTALKAAAQSASQLYYGMRQRMQDADIAATLRGEDLRIISPARPEPKPISPHPGLIGVLAFLLSLIASVGFVVARAMFDTSLSDPGQVEHWLHVPVLGMIPLMPGQSSPALRPQLGDGESADRAQGNAVTGSTFQEAITSLRTALAFNVGEGGNTLAVVSALPGEGKSTIAANLAAIYARLSGPTVLVDTDLRKPNVHRIFGLDNRVGLSGVLRGRTELDEALVKVGRQLTILPAGPPAGGPAELLHLHVRDLIAELQMRFSTVIVDGPPILGFSDAEAVVSIAHGVLLVVSAGQTRRDLVFAAHRHLKAARANLLGVVLNRVSSDINPYYDYYSKSYYSSYAPGEEDGDGDD